MVNFWHYASHSFFNRSCEWRYYCWPSIWISWGRHSRSKSAHKQITATRWAPLHKRKKQEVDVSQRIQQLYAPFKPKTKRDCSIPSTMVQRCGLSTQTQPASHTIPTFLIRSRRCRQVLCHQHDTIKLLQHQPNSIPPKSVKKMTDVWHWGCDCTLATGQVHITRNYNLFLFHCIQGRGIQFHHEDDFGNF